MTNTSTKGQGSPHSHFYHVTFHKDDEKWYAREVNGGKEMSFDTEEEAFDQVKEWVEELGIEGKAHVTIHDEHGKIRETRTI